MPAWRPRLAHWRSAGRLHGRARGAPGHVWEGHGHPCGASGPGCRSCSQDSCAAGVLPAGPPPPPATNCAPRPSCHPRGPLQRGHPPLAGAAPPGSSRAVWPAAPAHAGEDPTPRSAGAHCTSCWCIYALRVVPCSANQRTCRPAQPERRPLRRPSCCRCNMTLTAGCWSGTQRTVREHTSACLGAAARVYCRRLCWERGVIPVPAQPLPPPQQQMLPRCTAVLLHRRLQSSSPLGAGAAPPSLQARWWSLPPAPPTRQRPCCATALETPGAASHTRVSASSDCLSPF